MNDEEKWAKNVAQPWNYNFFLDSVDLCIFCYTCRAPIKSNVGEYAVVSVLGYEM